MKQFILPSMAILALANALNSSAAFDQNITAIYGGGNPDTGWTTADGDNGLVLALRGKNRENASTANVNGVYSFPVGTDINNAARSKWNWDFSIDTASTDLNDAGFDFYVKIDTDPSLGTSWITLNALTAFSDNSYGDASTLNGAGIEKAAPDLGDTIAQQSQNLVFVGGDPNLNATYDYELFAVKSGAGVDATKLADVTIQVVVGDGGSPVPDGGSLGFMFAGAAGMLGIARRFLSRC